MTQELDKWTILAYDENKDKMVEVLNLLRNAIDNDEMPKAKELLQANKKIKKGSNSIKRPSNSNIIYTNQLGKFGLLDIIRKFCDEHGINKQKLVPISKKISTILWKELSTVHQKFFEELALEVKKEHDTMYPSYNFQPKRNPSNRIKFKEFDPDKSKTKPVDCIPPPMNNTLVSRHEELDNEQTHEVEEYDEQTHEGLDDEDISEDESDDEDPAYKSISSPMNSTTAHVSVTTQYENDEFDEQMDEDNYEEFNDSPKFREVSPFTSLYINSTYNVTDINKPEISNSIFWNDALETRLCDLYMKDDVVDIFWGQPVEERLKGIINWHVYVVTRGLHNSYAKTETITDNQVINFIAEEEKLISFDDPLPNSIKIPQDLEESFDEALDNELGLSFREKHYNLVGIGTGYKRTKGKLTNIPAIILYVRQKGILRRGCDEIFPEKICGFSVDVVEACVATPCGDYCRRYQGDVKLGSSIGIGSNETLNTTGTLSAVACEKNSNRFGIISCEHVLKFNETGFENGATAYQPSYKDLFEPKRKLDELCKLSKEPGINRDDYESIMYDIELEENKLKRAREKNSTLATYARGMRKNFFSVEHGKKYGIDAGFCVFDNENRTLCPKKFSIPSTDFPTCLEGTYDLNDINNIKNLNSETEIFKVGRTTGLTFGYLFPASQAIACSLTVESIKIAKRLAMEKNIPFYDNLDQGIFIGYMKSHVDSEICQRRKKCFPTEWFDRQLAFLFKPGEFECGDSGASVVDKKGKALGILHAKLKTPNQTFAIASPYFAIIEALNVDICFSSDSITLTTISSHSSSSSPSS